MQQSFEEFMNDQMNAITTELANMHAKIADQGVVIAEFSATFASKDAKIFN